MRKSNTEDLVNIHHYHNKLAQTVDDAEWIGDYDKADFLNDHLKHVKEMMNRGELYYPLF